MSQIFWTQRLRLSAECFLGRSRSVSNIPDLLMQNRCGRNMQSCYSPNRVMGHAAYDLDAVFCKVTPYFYLPFIPFPLTHVPSAPSSPPSSLTLIPPKCQHTFILSLPHSAIAQMVLHCLWGTRSSESSVPWLWLSSCSMTCPQREPW